MLMSRTSWAGPVDRRTSPRAIRDFRFREFLKDEAIGPFVDEKDFRLLVELNENARRSFQALGRRGTLSAPAGRARSRRPAERRVVQGYWLSTNPRVAGRQDLLGAFATERTHEASPQ